VETEGDPRDKLFGENMYFAFAYICLTEKRIRAGKIDSILAEGAFKGAYTQATGNLHISSMLPDKAGIAG
jgi:hypothetical protein